MRPIENSSAGAGIVTKLAKVIASEGPLRIDEVDYPDPIAVISGKDWSLAILGPWRIMRNGLLVIDPDLLDDELTVETITDTLWDLIGRSIASVVPSLRDCNDPIFVLTDGYVIEVEAAGFSDAWVLHVNKHIFVGQTT